MVFGSASTHLPSVSVSGRILGDLRAWNSRSVLLCGAEKAYSLSALSQPPTDHSMFDWPEHTQTSPTSTFLYWRVLVPAMVMASGPPASPDLRVTAQPPLASALAATCWP